MCTLILIKHSPPQVEPEVPASRWRLSEEGRARCGALAEALAPYAPSAIFCSGEPKARETAEIVAARLAVECREAKDLHEHDRDNVPLLSQAEFVRSVQEFFHKPDLLVFGRETARQALQRFNQALEQVLAGVSAPCTAVVSHGTVISLLVGERTGCESFDLWQRLGLPSFVVLDGPPWRVREVVDCVAPGPRRPFPSC